MVKTERQWEKSAWFYERQSQKTIGGKVEFEKIQDMLVHIYMNYSNKKYNPYEQVMKIEKIVGDMLQYLKNDSKSPSLEAAEQKIGSYMLRVMLLKVVDWLKLEHKRVNIWGRKSIPSKPLIVNDNYPWCKSLILIVQEDEWFSKYFIVEKNKLYYSPAVDEETRNKARQLAFEEYNLTRIS